MFLSISVCPQQSSVSPQFGPLVSREGFPKVDLSLKEINSGSKSVYFFYVGVTIDLIFQQIGSVGDF